MPVVVTTSSAMPVPALFLPASIRWWDNGGGTRWFQRADAWRRARAGRQKIGQILHSWPVFGLLYLDSGRSAAISPHHSGAGFLAPLVFAPNPVWQRPTRIARKVPIATEQKADPDMVRG